MNYIRGIIQKLIIIIVFTFIFLSCVYQSNSVKSSVHNNAVVVALNTLEPDNLGYLSEGEVEEIDIPVIQTLSRRDLGFPRIEYVINSYENTIKRYSNRYGFDWRLILAVMNQESRFHTRAVSHRGAYGLMQIMPATGQDLSVALGIEGINNPKDNIAGGVYYIWRLYNIFETEENTLFTGVHKDDRVRLALAAYNAGPSRVRDAQKIAEYLNMDPTRWESIRDILPMLSRRYYSLHQFVWEGGRPSGGFFNGWTETVNYVDRVMTYYDHYQHIFE
jgi:membrane-bound lytic murein transglycosylase MltF